MEYVYENEKGDRRSIFASMKNHPPHAVRFRDETQWEPAGEVEGWPEGVWTRVYGDCQVRMGRSFPYISKRNARTAMANDPTCEKVKMEVGADHKHTVECPIVRSAEHEKYLAKKYGLEIE